jgi:hypothetical protein
LFLVHSNGLPLNPSVANYYYFNKYYDRNSNQIQYLLPEQKSI